MTKLILQTALAFLLTSLTFAQSPQTVTGTGCASVSVQGRATIAIQVIGTWTGTIQPQVSIAGQAAVNLPVTPSTSTTSQTTITGNGTFTANVSGYTTAFFCGATVTNTATLYIQTSEKVH